VGEGTMIGGVGGSGAGGSGAGGSAVGGSAVAATVGKATGAVQAGSQATSRASSESAKRSFGPGSWGNDDMAGPRRRWGATAGDSAPDGRAGG
jgi:hypothetical protein